MKHLSGRGCARIAAVGVLLAATALDVLYTGGTGTPLWPPAIVLPVALLAVLWPAGLRPDWLTPQLRTAVPAILSLLYTAHTLLPGRTGMFGPGESALLLCLLFIAVRHCPRPWALVCGVLDAAALVSSPVRWFGTFRGDAVAFVLLGLVLVGLVTGLAAYLRSQDYRRTVAVGETRRSERVAIAADLHDFVAHHVTGILVQTQVARMMAASRTNDVNPVLAGIEHAATEALSSMRRTVGVLRDTGPESAGRRPVGDLAGITDLAEHFAGPIQKVTVHRDPAVPGDLPHEVQAGAFRVVQEALTNVRRHAGDATEITVRLDCAEGRLRVSVADDGRGGSQLPEDARGGGFGLVGLTERVTALGGSLHAGPRAGAGYGWEVRAEFPVRRR
ncbi:sensor histidine kinase [Streptomyces sp. TRM68367]|uniref:sensor histidine kinase n=1 Tax=Streptomyces sp. TRM68367 TaxID=2758415 RepID=UPI00165AA76D|nr:histidine kinase [Streptomyces sp. TRM68367]MBC9730608.1 sensor histidine kinase [Streptomyces sp. TRM68367]